MLYGTLNISPQDLDAVVVTHEHTDHIQSIGNLSKKFNLPIYATSETFDAMPVQTDKITFLLDFIKNPDHRYTFQTKRKFPVRHLAVLRR